MDLGLNPGETKFRDELRAWLKVNLPSKASRPTRTDETAKAYYQYLKDWQRKLYDGGYAGIAWPKEYGGRAATFIEQAMLCSTSVSDSASPINRYKYARDIPRLRAAKALFPLFSRTAARASLILYSRNCFSKLPVGR